ncbi:MAG: nucleotidyl transferase AbiEii/AbiGii toxin family protein [Pirellulales bacterium]
MAAKILAAHPAGRGLCLVGGFRYRLLDESPRASTDLDYHWEGDLQEKQAEIVAALRDKLLPEVKRQLGYDGNVRPAVGPQAESPAVRIVELAFYRVADPGSRIEIPVEITAVARLDKPMVHTMAGTVFLTVSDADMIESKILACLGRSFFQVRDVLDIFLFQDALRPDSPARLSQKLGQRALPPSEAIERLASLTKNRTIHVRAVERLLDEQVDSAVTVNLRAAGGAEMIWDSVMRLLHDLFAQAGEAPP